MNDSVTKNRLREEQILEIVKRAFGKGTGIYKCTELEDGSNDQYTWVHGLFEKVWKSLEEEESIWN